MSDLRTAAQQALEALLTYEQYIQPLTDVFGGPRVPEEGSASAKVDAAITALRAALAEPPTNQCGETCERAKLCAACARELAEPMKPLAEWQINDLMADIDPEDVCSWSFRQGVYAAEKHHGIGP